MKSKEEKFWDVDSDMDGKWNSAAKYSIRFSNIIKLKNPVDAVGFQAPFARSKKETIDKVISKNPELKSLLSN